MLHLLNIRVPTKKPQPASNNPDQYCFPHFILRWYLHAHVRSLGLLHPHLLSLRERTRTGRDLTVPERTGRRAFPPYIHSTLSIEQQRRNAQSGAALEDRGTTLDQRLSISCVFRLAQLGRCFLSTRSVITRRSGQGCLYSSPLFSPHHTGNRISGAFRG